MADSKDIGGLIETLASRFVDEQKTAADRYGEVAQRLLRGGFLERDVRDAYMTFVREEATRYAATSAGAAIAYYRALFEVGRLYGDRFLDAVVTSKPTTKARAGQARASRTQRRKRSRE